MTIWSSEAKTKNKSSLKVNTFLKPVYNVSQIKILLYAVSFWVTYKNKIFKSLF